MFGVILPEVKRQEAVKDYISGKYSTSQITPDPPLPDPHNQRGESQIPDPPGLGLRR